MKYSKHYSSLFIILLGLGAIIKSSQYGFGRLDQMGPGYFPMLLGAVLVILGLLISVNPEFEGDEDTAVKQSFKAMVKSYARPWACVIAGLVAFIFVGEYGGFVPAIFALIFISAHGDRKNSLKAILLLAAITTVVSVLLFSYGMNLQFRLFAWG